MPNSARTAVAVAALIVALAAAGAVSTGTASSAAGRHPVVRADDGIGPAQASSQEPGDMTWG
jgi:hypothetical protein